MDPQVTFPFYNYILNILFQFLLLWKKDLFSLKFQLMVGVIGSIVFLIVIPGFTLILEKDSTANHYVSGILVILMGFISALCQAGFFNLVAHFPLEMIVALSTGQGFSGISMNILQYIALFSVTGNDDKAYNIRGWIFFIISAVVLGVCLALLLFYYNTDYFRFYLEPKPRDTPHSNLLDNEANNENNEEKINNESENLTNESVPPVTPFNEFKALFKRLWDLDLLMLYIYILTFTLFPNASIKQNLFGLDPSFNANTIITIYNVFDTIGRYLVSKIKPNKKLNMIMVLARSVLFFTLIFNDYSHYKLGWNVDTTSILLFFNVAILACTNGITNTLTFGLAPEQVSDDLKGQAGTSLSFFLIFGIFLGSCIAILLQKIMNLYDK
jgi:hypothetical protein